MAMLSRMMAWCCLGQCLALSLDIGARTAASAMVFSPTAAVTQSNRARMTIASLAATTSDTFVSPPRDREEMLAQAAEAVARARVDGITRGVLRLLLPRGNAIVPPDESWEGGIMQLFSVCSPLVKDLLRKISVSTAGVPPSLREQRLDASGVDGESVWMAQSSKPSEDGVAFVQPSAEVLDSIEQVCANAGERPVLMVNPQWREGDDPLDALSRQGGLVGALGCFLGGKAATERRLAELGFRPVYTLAQFSCRGSNVVLTRSYPSDWAVFVEQGSEDEPEFLFSATERPTYQSVEEQLVEQGVPFRFASELFTPGGIVPSDD